MNAFAVCKLEKWWCVVERRTSKTEQYGYVFVLVSYHDTRDAAREAARQLNREERRFAESVTKR